MKNSGRDQKHIALFHLIEIVLYEQSAASAYQKIKLVRTVRMASAHIVFVYAVNGDFGFH
jgi:hypothetical protein